MQTVDCICLIPGCKKRAVRPLTQMPVYCSHDWELLPMHMRNAWYDVFATIFSPHPSRSRVARAILRAVMYHRELVEDIASQNALDAYYSQPENVKMDLSILFQDGVSGTDIANPVSSFEIPPPNHNNTNNRPTGG